MDPRTFPLLHGEGRIPWAWAEWFYRCYAAMEGRGQSLERLAQRGGSSRGEIQLYAQEVRDAVGTSRYIRSVDDLPLGERPDFIDPELASAVEQVWLERAPRDPGREP